MVGVAEADTKLIDTTWLLKNTCFKVGLTHLCFFEGTIICPHRQGEPIDKH